MHSGDGNQQTRSSSWRYRLRSRVQHHLENSKAPAPALARRNAQQIASPTTTNDSVTPATDQYRRAKRIPSLVKAVYVFPDADDDISKDHQERFPAIKNMFQRNVEQSCKLQDCMRHISYELKMCGSNIEDATPSLLVFCPATKIKTLRSLLTQRQLTDQYKPPHSLLAHLPRFRIFFWAEQIELLWGDTADVNLHVHGDSPGLTSSPEKATLCGALVTAGPTGDRRSTLGCVIRVGSQYFGLTSAHTFEKSTAHETTGNSYEGDDDEPNYYDIDDFEYDFDSLARNEGRGQICDDSRYMNPSPRSPLQESKSAAPLTPADESVMACTIRRPPSERPWVVNHDDLDWALVELPGEAYQRPNAYFSEQKRILFSEVASARPFENTEVIIISSRRFVMRGVLHSTPSYIGSPKNFRMPEVWTISLSGNDTLERGDSGSLVVDARTNIVYGHVIAVNPLGDLYAVPLWAVLDQIKGLFETLDVSLRLQSPLVSHGRGPSNEIEPLQGGGLPSRDSGSSYRNYGQATEIGDKESYQRDISVNKNDSRGSGSSIDDGDDIFDRMDYLKKPRPTTLSRDKASTSLPQHHRHSLRKFQKNSSVRLPPVLPTPFGVSSSWSSHDDNILLDARSRSLGWGQIQREHFPQKTPNACRKRYERLVGKTRGPDWDHEKFEKLSREYSLLREQTWKPLADAVGEPWEDVEKACFEKGLKSLRVPSRTLAGENAPKRVHDESGGDHQARKRTRMSLKGILTEDSTFLI